MLQKTTKMAVAAILDLEKQYHYYLITISRHSPTSDRLKIENGSLCLSVPVLWNSL